MMKTSADYRRLYAKTVALYISALFIFTAAANLYLYQEQKSFFQQEFSYQTGEKLELLETMIMESLIKNDYGAVEQALNHWAQSNDNVAFLQAMTHKGFDLINYRKADGADLIFTITNERTVYYGDGWSLTIQLTETFPQLEQLLYHHILRNLFISTVGVLLFGIILWILFVKLALRPVTDHAAYVDEVNRDLEKIVQDKTASLIELNKNLEAKVQKETEERARQERLLMQQAKMASLGEMLGAIAHQLKQPLTIISLEAQNAAFEMEDNLPETASHALQDIDKQVHHMGETIEHFRNFLKPSLKKSSFRGCEMVHDVVKLMEAQLKKLEISVQIPDHEHFDVYGYPSDVKHVILNIINNSRDAFTQNDITDRRIFVSFSKDEYFGMIHLRDNAGGIDPALLPDKLFGNYVTTKGDQGTGIGLAISKTIIEQKMNGKLTTRNVDGGAEFTIQIPLVSSDIPESKTTHFQHSLLCP